MLEKLLTANRIKTGLTVAGWEELVEEVGAIMVAAGDIEQAYTGAMKEVIREMGPYCVIAPGVALLHARPGAGVNRLCIALASLDKGIEFGSVNDPVFLAFGLGAVDGESHIALLGQLAGLLQDKGRVQRLMEAKDVSDILALIKAPALKKRRSDF